MEMTKGKLRTLSKSWEIQSISEMIVEKTKKPTYTDPYLLRRRFRKFYHDEEATDLTVVVGRTKTHFNLHKTIVCSCSGFFNGASQDHWSQTRLTGVWLKHIEVVVFEIIALWIYGHGYMFPGAPLGRRLVKDTYIAADYLLMPELKAHIIWAAKGFWTKEMLKTGGEIRYDNDPYDLFRTLCAYSHTRSRHSSEFEGLRSCAVVIIRGFGSHRVGVPKFKNVEDDKDDDSDGDDDDDHTRGVAKIFELLIEAYDDLIRAAICTDCYPQWEIHAQSRYRCSSVKCRSAKELLALTPDKNPFNSRLD
ncbi:hypothetical protein TWF970_011405 [Orbilia oligospora]|uniref:BTB domain-containing protein n=1 Tax=Orbilia oligospora TaxID=2813651 RepID=A0A7C8RCF4_ORBOL|nr:hypothetical protein TWF970_011405 [Orbilia oligospora]